MQGDLVEPHAERDGERDRLRAGSPGRSAIDSPLLGAQRLERRDQPLVAARRTPAAWSAGASAFQRSQIVLVLRRVDLARSRRPRPAGTGRSRRRCRGARARRRWSTPRHRSGRSAGHRTGRPPARRAGRGWRGAPRWRRRRVRSPSDPTGPRPAFDGSALTAAAASSPRTRATGSAARPASVMSAYARSTSGRPATASRRSRWLASGSCRPVSSPLTTRAGRADESTSDVQPSYGRHRALDGGGGLEGPDHRGADRDDAPTGRAGDVDQPGRRLRDREPLRLRRLVRLLARHAGVQHQRRHHDARGHQVDQQPRADSGRPALGISALPGTAA